MDISKLNTELDQAQQRIATLELQIKHMEEMQSNRGEGTEPLNQREERSRLLFDTMPMGVIYQNADGFVIDANPAAEKILGLTLDQLQGRTSMDPDWRAIHEDGSEFPGNEHPVVQALHTGLPVRDVVMGVYNPVMKTHRWININAVPRFKAGDQKPFEAYTTFEDITERKFAEELLRKSEERFRRITSLTSDYAFTQSISEDGTSRQLEWISEKFTKDFGLTMANMNRGNPWAMIYEEDVTSLQTEFQKILSGNAWSGEMRIMKTDGSLSWVHVYIQPEWDSLENRVVRIHGAIQDIHKRKTMEDALTISEARYRQLFNATPVGIILAAPNGQILDVNPATLSILNSPSVEATKSINLINFPLLQSAGISADFQKTVETCLPLAVERPYTSKWNKPVNLYVRFTPILNDLGVLQSIQIIVEDITERRQAEDALRHSEALLSEAQRIGRIGHWEWVAGHEEIICSSEMLQILGFDPSIRVISQKMVIQQIEPEDRKRLRLLDEAGISSRSDLDYEYRILLPDGAHRWIHQYTKVTYNDAGEPIRMMGIIQDITRRKQIELELLESQNFLEQRVKERTSEVQDLYDKAPAGYHSLDANGVIISINQTELDWLGYRREELIGQKSMRDLYTAESQAIFSERFPRFKIEGYVNDLEFEIIRKDGSILPILLNASAVYNERGEFVMSRATMFNITERKQAERKLRAANIALERAAKLKDEFLANMSHELRTPLNGVVSLSESLEEGVYGPLTQRQIEVQRIVAESGRHLVELINDILDLSKIEAGKLELKPELLKVEELCQASLQMVKQIAMQKHIQISYSTSNSVDFIQADKRRFKQMLVNLLSNAVKFTSDGGQIGLDVRLENRTSLCCTVWDTGIGIPSEKFDQLFQPFTQLDSALSRQYEGTGLGLALVRTLAELHGGSVRVESKVGVGSRFHFVIPLKQPGFTQPVRENPKEIQKGNNSQHNAITILIAEDNPINFMVTSDYLSTKGYKVIEAINGLDAIEKVNDNKPNLIIMDIQMPGLDGIETIKRLRATPEAATIPIIALTALAMPGDRERCLEAGANEYIAKPASLKELAKLVENLTHH
ncbi:MAG: PAS domain S-box protein [Anaerolineales bacterium]